MNIFLNEYFGFCFELNFELNHFSARFNENMNFQNGSARAKWGWGVGLLVANVLIFWSPSRRSAQEDAVIMHKLHRPDGTNFHA